MAGIFEPFLLRFQSQKPLIYLLYNGFGDLLHDLMANFVIRSSLMSNGQRKEAKDLGVLDLNVSGVVKDMHDIEPGTQAKHLMVNITAHEKQKKLLLIKSAIKACYTEVVSYLQKHLPHDSNFLRDARAIHPEFKKHTSGQASFGRLAYVMANILKNTSSYLQTPEQFADTIKRQYSMFQSVDFTYDPTKNIDHFWSTVGAYVGVDGSHCFRELASLAIHCLCVSHGNAIPERGFSVNKRMLQDRTPLKEGMIVALRMVKESIEMHNGNVRLYTDIFNIAIISVFLLLLPGRYFSHHPTFA